MLPILAYFKGYLTSQNHLIILKKSTIRHYKPTELKITVLHIFLIWTEILARV